MRAVSAAVTASVSTLESVNDLHSSGELLVECEGFAGSGLFLREDVGRGWCGRCYEKGFGGRVWCSGAGGCVVWMSLQVAWCVGG